MRRLASYILMFTLALGLVFIIYLSYAPAPKVQYVPSTTRGAMTADEYIDRELKLEGNKIEKTPIGSIDWTGISAGLATFATIFVVYAGMKRREDLDDIKDNMRKGFSENSVTQGLFKEDLEKIKIELMAVRDERYRKHVYDRITEIEIDRSGFVRSAKMKAFFEGIGARTREFSRDVMNHNFSDHDYDKSLFKINARIEDGKAHASHLRFNEADVEVIDQARAVAIEGLKGDLERLALDKWSNHKYERFGDIIIRFVKLYYGGIIENYVQLK